METCSPSKRRALAPLNANALGSPSKLFKNINALGHSPVKMSMEGRKRLLEAEGAAASPVVKKACLGREEDASEKSHSPESSSLFDTSANDASWATAVTEPDAIATATAAFNALPSSQRSVSPRPRLTLTRQQVREKAEILRLRLSLANYKVRTGQTTVPLSDLQPRPLPHVSTPTETSTLPPPSSNTRTVRVQSPQPPPSSDPPSSEATELAPEEEEEEEVERISESPIEEHTRQPSMSQDSATR